MKYKKTTLQTLRLLLPYLWPEKRNDLRLRVIFALTFLFLAKMTNVFIPIILGKSVDSLNALSNKPDYIILTSIVLIISYGITRIVTFAFGEIKDALFSKVSQHAIRQVALTVFKHLLNLSLSFHLDRYTGALSRFIDRGTKGVEFLLRFVIFNILPNYYWSLCIWYGCRPNL